MFLSSTQSFADEQKYYTCSDGSVTTDQAYCPQEPTVIACDLGYSKYVTIDGLGDKPALAVVEYTSSDSFDWITLRLDQNDMSYDFYRFVYLEDNYYVAEPGALTITSNSKVNGSWVESQIKKYNVDKNSSGNFIITNDGGARMVFEECIFDNVVKNLPSDFTSNSRIKINCLK